jgi:hypothetical protein
VLVAILRRVAFFTATALIVASVLAAVVGAHPPKPTNPNAALADGCQRSDLGIGFGSTPEWVYVYRSPAIRLAKGVVRLIHGALQDGISQHRSYDFNANLVPEKPFRYLVAGNPGTGTNNYAASQGEARARLHFEWESATLPFFAWPTEGDRATLWGSWIWDCGHWQSTENNTGGTTTGEHTELHPLNALVVNRRASYLSKAGESETDAFISNQGDAAHAVEQCALSHHPVSGGGFPQYDAGFRPCSTSVPNRIQPLEPSYTFFAPAPPRPSPRAVLRYRIVTRVSGNSGSQHVTIRPNGITVTVRLPDAKHVVRYGKSFFLSWSRSPAVAPTALKVTVKSVLIKQADPNPALPDPSGANWSLYLDVNGYWQLLNNWAPALTAHVTDGERIAINRSFTIYVPHATGVWLQVNGRECDEPAGKTLFGLYANLLYPCPANTDEQNPDIFQLLSNDDTGTILNAYSSAGAAVGSHVATSAAYVNFPGSGRQTFGNRVPGQGDGDYQLTYTVSRVQTHTKPRGTSRGTSRSTPVFTASGDAARARAR